MVEKVDGAGENSNDLCKSVGILARSPSATEKQLHLIRNDDEKNYDDHEENLLDVRKWKKCIMLGTWEQELPRKPNGIARHKIHKTTNHSEMAWDETSAEFFFLKRGLCLSFSFPLWSIQGQKIGVFSPATGVCFLANQLSAMSR
jgi:hypothetical protein